METFQALQASLTTHSRQSKFPKTHITKIINNFANIFITSSYSRLLDLHHLSNSISSFLYATAVATTAARLTTPAISRQHFFAFFIIVFSSIFFCSYYNMLNFLENKKGGKASLKNGSCNRKHSGYCTAWVSREPH